MSTCGRRSFSGLPRNTSLRSSSATERSHSVSEQPGNQMARKPQLAKKRPPLSNVTNQKNGSQNAVRTAFGSKAIVPCENKLSKLKKGSSTFDCNANVTDNPLPSPLYSKSVGAIFNQNICAPTADSSSDSVTPFPASTDMEVSPSQSSLDETMSTCDSLKSPEFEYMDNVDALAVNFIERKTYNNLNISDNVRIAGDICKREILVEVQKFDKVIDVDENITDPQFCASIACEIYEHLHLSEKTKRPAVDFMERIQKDINASMRATLIDWLVEVAEEYRLALQTLFLAVNYIDRYLSGNSINRQRLQLLGVSCMMIAAKHEEICAPQVEEFCYITDNTYFKDEVLAMESNVLNYLKFEMTATTVNCFLRRFVHVAQKITKVPVLQLECMACYIAELSLLEYSMLSYAPSLIAASATFLAKYILLPSQRPWTSTLRHYTLYKPSELCDCVKTLHRLCCDAHYSSLPAIREKYSQHKYKNVAKKIFPASIPSELFYD